MVLTANVSASRSSQRSLQDAAGSVVKALSRRGCDNASGRKHADQKRLNRSMV